MIRTLIHLFSMIVLYNSVDAAEFDASISTLVNYLIGIAVGDVFFSLLLAILIALPVLLDRSSGIQRFVVREAKFVAGKATTAAQKATTAAHKATTVAHNAVGNFLPKNRQESTEMNSAVESEEGVAEDEETGGLAHDENKKSEGQPPLSSRLPSQVSITEETTTTIKTDDGLSTSPEFENANSKVTRSLSFENTTDGVGATFLPLPSSNTSSDLADYVLEIEREDRPRFVIWFFLGFILFVSGLTLALIGVVEVFDNSIIASTLQHAGASSVAVTIKIIFIAALCLVGFFDVLVVGRYSCMYYYSF